MLRLRTLPALCLLGLSLPLAAQTPTIGACTVLPSDNIWNTAIDQLPVSSSSATWVGTIGTSSPLHPNFGADPTNGIPYVTVPGTQTKYPATFTYADQSDAGPYAIPLNAPIEGGSASTGDRHAIAIDTDNCVLYELFAAYPQTASWTAGSGAIYALASDALRPAGWTSADAAGLPIFPGLVRYDEVAAGAIHHAIRFTAPQTQNTYVWPARHFASTLTGSQYPPMGARFRLRADFDISGFSAANQVILTALKKYGMFLADNGSAWFIEGAPDTRWSDDDLHNLTQITGTDFEAVDDTVLMVSANSGQALQTTVTVTVNPTAASLKTGASQQFSASVANAASQSVTWSVNGIAGGSAAVGLVSSTGLYTAPATVPTGGTVAVQAASTVSPTAVGAATVSISAAANPPVLSSIAPSSGVQGASVSVVLTGSGFTSASSIAVSGTGISVTRQTVVSATRISATLAIAAGAPTGARSVTVSTAGGASSAVTFTVVAAKPTLVSVSPSAIRVGASAQITLTGTNFASGATVSVAGAGVTVSQVAVVSAGTITAQVSLASKTARGSHSIVVTTAGGTSNALTLTAQ